jgi:hypothetical protein
MINVSAAMAGEFSFAAAELTAEICRLGPNPLRSNGIPPKDSPTDQGGTREDETEDVTLK